MEPIQNTQVSSDPETKGFDLSAGKTWIYPENYPVRDYQFNIVQACLYKNTLVCLPTGKDNCIYHIIRTMESNEFIKIYNILFLILIRLGKNIYCCSYDV